MSKKLPLPTPRRLYSDDCPEKYTGPIEGACGTRPFNGYLWPTESWWIYNEQGMGRHSSRFHFGYVHLADGVADGGSFAVSGHLHDIKPNSRRCSWERKPDQLPKPNNFPTRRAAIRTAAADLLRLARCCRRWKGHGGYGSGDLRDAVMFSEVVNWVRAVVARETEAGAPRVMIAAPLPSTLPPPPEPTGFDLLDLMLGIAA